MRLKLIGLALLLVVLKASYAQAATSNQQASNITVRPFLQELSLNSDESSKQFELTVSNNSTFKQVFHLSTVDFGALNETGGLVFEGANSKQFNHQYGLAKWLSIGQNDFELAADKSANITIRVNNDTDLAPGAHYAAVIVSASRSVAPVEQLTITPKVSSLVFLTKHGGEKYDIHLASVSHNGKLWRPPSLVNLRLKSTGNTYIIPRGVVSLKQGKRILAKGIINPQSSIVLPQSIRAFDVPLSTVASANKSLLLTHYAIQVDYRYDGNPNFATRTYPQFYINKTQVLGLLVIVIVIVGGLVYGFKNKHRIKKKLGKNRPV
jgi:hypothetical protein